MSSVLKFSPREIQEHNGLRFDEKVDPSVLQDPGLAGRLLPDFRVEIEFSVGGSRILMAGKFKGAWELECARCLTQFSAPVESPFEEIYALTDAEIDAGEEVRQALVLAAPSKALCRPDCRGLCPSCGKDLNKGDCGCPKDGPPTMRITRSRN